jgi:hypothetical protein
MRNNDESFPADRFRQVIKQAHGDVHVILAPPRSCSTLLARVLWNCPPIAFYAHEPFDATYHQAADLSSALAKLQHPVDLRNQVKPKPTTGTGLLIKELSFQAGDAFPLLASLTPHPVLFVLRDPRLTIASRMRMRTRDSLPASFPGYESGWEQLSAQVKHCRARAIPHRLVDTTDMRRVPTAVMPRICAALDLPYDEGMLHWIPAEEVRFGLAVERQEGWNARVLASTAIYPPDEELPDLSEFPASDGMRSHVESALDIYRSLLAAPERLRPDED